MEKSSRIVVSVTRLRGTSLCVLGDVEADVCWDDITMKKRVWDPEVTGDHRYLYGFDSKLSRYCTYSAQPRGSGELIVMDGIRGVSGQLAGWLLWTVNGRHSGLGDLKFSQF
jgi:hypothetical protein